MFAGLSRLGKVRVYAKLGNNVPGAAKAAHYV
jgi:hypothetical protein